MHADIDEREKKRVIEMAHSCVHKANALLGCKLETPEIRFDLRGRAAGQFCVRRNCVQLRFNGALFAKYFEENLEQTVPHEVAHFLVYALFMKHGNRRVLPHGREWRQMMRLLGAKPATRHDFDLSDIPVRREQRFAWRCDCRTHSIAKRTHLRMLRGEQRVCVHCKGVLVFPKHQGG